MGIVINVMAVLYITLHGTIIGSALFAEPYAVITNALVLVLVLFCLINIFFFSVHNFCLHHFKATETTGKRNHHTACCGTHPTTCYGWLLLCCSSGYAINSDTKQNNTKTLLSSAFIPVILGAVTLFLKTLISRLLNNSGGDQVHKRSNDSRDQSAEGNTTELIEDEEILNP